MEIKNYVNAVNSYSNANYDRNKVSAEKNVSLNRNTDRVEFSMKKEMSVESFSSALAAAIKGDAGAERTAGLCASVSTGQYNIKAELISKSILD